MRLAGWIKFCGCHKPSSVLVWNEGCIAVMSQPSVIRLRCPQCGRRFVRRVISQTRHRLSAWQFVGQWTCELSGTARVENSCNPNMFIGRFSQRLIFDWCNKRNRNYRQKWKYIERNEFREWTRKTLRKRVYRWPVTKYAHQTIAWMLYAEGISGEISPDLLRILFINCSSGVVKLAQKPTVKFSRMLPNFVELGTPVTGEGEL